LGVYWVDVPADTVAFSDNVALFGVEFPELFSELLVVEAGSVAVLGLSTFYFPLLHAIRFLA